MVGPVTARLVSGTAVKGVPCWALLGAVVSSTRTMLFVPAGTVTMFCCDAAVGMMLANANKTHRAATAEILELRILFFSLPAQEPAMGNDESICRSMMSSS